MSSITVKLLIWVSLAITLGLTAIGIVRYKQEHSRLTTEIDETSQQIMARLQTSVPGAVVDLDHEYLANAVRAEMRIQDVRTIRVIADEVARPLQAQTRDEHWQSIAETNPSPTTPTQVAPLIYDNLAIGRIELVIDDRWMQEKLRSLLIYNIGQVLVMNLIVLVATWLIINRITDPIRRLTLATQNMAVGDLDQEIDVQANDEIGTLATSFQQMNNAVREKIDVIEEQNRDLDRRVKERTAQLEAAQEELVEAAHESGRAEMATGVLHNIGNILTNVCISTERLEQALHGTTAEQVKRIAELLREHQDGLDTFLTTDPKGSKIPRFFIMLDGALAKELNEQQTLFAKISEGIALIKDSVRLQQEYARSPHFDQELDLEREIDDMLRLQANSLERLDIDIIRNMEQVPAVFGQRSKMANIIVNLLTNARDAVRNNPPGSRRIQIDLINDDGGVVLRVTDNGEGIAGEDLKRIFSFGFTTKESGHGFGLHHSANAMTEMGGKLSVHSDGHGTGATFSLSFPASRIRHPTTDLSKGTLDGAS